MVVATLAILDHHDFATVIVGRPNQYLFDFENGDVPAFGALRVSREQFAVANFFDLLTIRTSPDIVVDAAEKLFGLFGVVQELVVLIFFQTDHFSGAGMTVAWAVT